MTKSVFLLVAAAAALAGCGDHQQNTPGNTPPPSQVQAIEQRAKQGAATPPGGPNHPKAGAPQSSAANPPGSH